MKDILFKASTIKAELLVLLVCLGLAFLINLASIIVYQTSFLELFTMLHYVVIIGITFYVIVFLVRLIIKSLNKKANISS